MVVLITSSQEVTDFALPKIQPLPDYLQQNIAQLEADYQSALLPEFSLRRLHGNGAKCISTVALGQEVAAENNTSPTPLEGPIPLAQLHQDATTARQALLQFLTTKLPCTQRRYDPLLDILALPRHTRFGGQEALFDFLVPEPCMPLAFESHIDTRQAVRDELLEVILALPCDTPPDLPSANASDIITRPQKIAIATAAVDEEGGDGFPKPQPDYLQALLLSSTNTHLATEFNITGPLTLAEPVFFEETASHIKPFTELEPVEDLNWMWAVEHARSEAFPEAEALPCIGVEELRALGEPVPDWKPEKLPVIPCNTSKSSRKQPCSIISKLVASIDALQWTSKLSLLPAVGQLDQTQEASNKATRCAIQPVECPMPPMAFFSEGKQKGSAPILTLSAFPDVFTKLPVDAAGFLLTGDTEACLFSAAAAPQEPGSLSLLWALVAKEMMPDDGCYMLPPIDQVLLNSSSRAKVAAEGNPRCLTVTAALAECGASQTMSTAGEALYLDWGLSTKEASLRPVELLEACKRTAALLYPGPRAVVLQNNKRGNIGARFGGDVILQNLLDLGGCKDLFQTGINFHTHATLSISAAPQRSGQVEAVACFPSVENAHNKASNPPPAKRPRRDGAPGKGGLQFFVGLQKPSIPGTYNGDFNEEQQGGNTTRIQEEKSSEMSEGMPSPPQRAIQGIETSLSPAHAALFEQLRQEDASLLSTLPSEILSSDVANAPFPHVGAIGAFLRSRLQGHSHSAPKTPVDAALARALGSMAICRQAAALLLHHGVRSAGLYLEASIRELPGVLAACTAVQAVQVAAGKVEAGDGEDHPKHTALRRSLISMATLIPGAKHLVIGDPKSFFSLYSIIRAAGLCPCHLDPSGQLLAAGADTCAVREAVASACQLADCVLVAVDLLTSSQPSALSSFPLDMFQHVVVYSTETDAQQSVLACLEGRECSITLLQITAPVTPTKRVEERPRSQMRAVVEHHVFMKATAAASAFPLGETPIVPAPDWPLVVSSSPERPIKNRTALYEGLLGLERSGAVIVERLMQRIDLVLSPSAALVVVLCEDEQPEFDDFYNATSETLKRASYSFTKLFFVCEGNAAFRAQVLCGMPRLLALAAGFGVILQCNVTTDSSSTAAAIQTVAEAHLTEWKARKTGRHYLVGDPPSPQEFFLERFPSLNAHSAAVLARCGLSLQEVLSLDSLPPGKIPALLGLVPTHSMELFVKCAAFGDRLVGGDVGMGAHVGMHAQQQQQDDQHRNPPQEHMWQENPLHSVVPSHQAKRPRLEQQQAEEAAAAAAAVMVDANQGDGGDGNERAAYAAWLQQQHQEEARQYQQAYEQQYQPTFQATSAPGDIHTDMAIPDLECLEDFLADDAGCGSEATSSPNWRGGPLGGQQQPHPGSTHLNYLQRPGPSPLGGRQVGRQGMQQHHMQPHAQHAQQAQHVQQGFYPPQSAYTAAAPGPVPAPSHAAHQFALQKRAYGSEVDEFGMPLDPSVLFQVDGDDDGDDEVSMSMNNGAHHMSGSGGGQRVRFMEHQQQGYGGQMQQRQQQQVQRHTVSAYATQGGQHFPVPGPGYLQRQQAPSEHGYEFGHPSGDVRNQGGEPMYQQAPVYNGMQQQQPGGRPMPQQQQQQQAPWHQQQHPQQQPSVGGARGYTAAALQQQQPASNQQGGLTSPTASAGYMRRKWGAASGGKGRRGGGGGRSGGGGKYTSRTSRQW